jgi:DNA-binding NtrC family response regulator
MAAVYGIVKNHNGWIGVNSKLGKGTTVKIYMPEKQVTPQIKTNNEALVCGCSILLIEDEDAAMAVNREMIEFLGHSAIEAKTGAEAVEIVKNYRGNIDLAILDYDLPDMKGDKVYRLIKDSAPEMKIIFSTGYDVEDIADEMQLDQKHFIQKPYSLTKLSAALKTILKGR